MTPQRTKPEHIIRDDRTSRRERADRGYSRTDCWSFDTFLAGVIAGGCRELAERHHGYPGNLSQDDDPEGEKASAHWASILEEIASGFEWYVKGKFETFTDMPPEFEKSFDLFREYFGALWD